MKNLSILIAAIMLLSACGNGVADGSGVVEPQSSGDCVEVLYFHGKQRCVTCNAIERLTGEVVETDFAPQLKDGKIRFQVVDISTRQGEALADRYEVTWSSLFVNKIKDGKQTDNNMTDFGFSCAKNSPETFKEGLRTKINELLK